MVDFIGAVRDPQFRQDVGQGLVDAAGRGLAMIGGAPVDLTTMFLRPLGYSVPDEQIIGSSEYLGRQMADMGLISQARNPVAEFLSALLIPDPTDIQKLAPVIERAIAKGAQNLAAPRTLSRQAGQIGVTPTPRQQSPREEALRIAQENAAKPVSEGGLGLPPDNTAMDRARAMGFDVNVYHGTRNAEPITELIPGGRQGAYRSGDAYGVGVYSTTDPRFASSPVYTGETGAVMPLLLNRQEHLNLSSLTPENLNLLERFAAENLLPSDKSRFSSAISQRTFDPDDIEAAKEFFSAQQKNAEQLGGGYDRTQPWVDKDDQGNFVINYTDFDAPVSIKNKEDVETLLKAVGYDATRLMGFAGHTLNKSGSEQWDVTFSPNKLRSRFAAFDPARRYESDLLGSVDPRLLAILGPATAAAVYGLGELYANQRRDEQTR